MPAVVFPCVYVTAHSCVESNHRSPSVLLLGAVPAGILIDGIDVVAAARIM